MAAINRSGFFALRLSTAISRKNVRAISLSSFQLATDKSVATVIPKKISLDNLEKTQSELERQKKMSSMITVEGPVDVGTTSVSLFPLRSQHKFVSYLRLVATLNTYGIVRVEN
jgi:hypothetical protein